VATIITLTMDGTEAKITIHGDRNVRFKDGTDRLTLNEDEVQRLSDALTALITTGQPQTVELADVDELPN
jgi:hypothetical protein